MAAKNTRPYSAASDDARAAVFSTACHDAEPFDEVVSCVIDALHAADVVGLRAAGGRPDVAVRHDVRVERPARPDGSRSSVVLARIGPPPPSVAAAADDDRAARSAGR